VFDLKTGVIERPAFGGRGRARVLGLQKIDLTARDFRRGQVAARCGLGPKRFLRTRLGEPAESVVVRWT